MNPYSRAEVLCVIAIFFMVAEIAHGQTFSDLVSFVGPNGANPETSPLVQGADGNFYGTTSHDGAYGGGTVFKVTPNGVLTTVYNFCSQANCADGNSPQSGVVQGSDGNLYGTTIFGGFSSPPNCQGGGCGTVFKVTPSGVLTVLHSFCAQKPVNCDDGLNPIAGLLLAADGNFYGTTWQGGANCGACGTVFRITPSGDLTTLHSFNVADGAYPLTTMTEGTRGELFGSTAQGGKYSNGTVFEITVSGKFLSLCSFTGNGNETELYTSPNGVIQALDGNLYGTTYEGGNDNQGTAFRLAPSGRLTTLYTFCQLSDCADGLTPSGLLVQGTDGNLYGTTISGGTGGPGTIFQITISGAFTTLYQFCTNFECTDGVQPSAGMIQATNGTFYGTTNNGGSTWTEHFDGDGVLFSLWMNFGPFVKAIPNIGRVGRVIQIFGNNLTGTTGVTFNGISAEFKVISDTDIKAEVPSGATSGAIQLTTPSGLLSSNVPFEVAP